jgi:hypothetical protein
MQYKIKYYLLYFDDITQQSTMVNIYTDGGVVVGVVI